MRRAVLGAVLAVSALVAAPAGAQQVSARFEIKAVGDTTFEFRTGGLRWIRPSTRGIVVDAAKRDVLVARFRVLSVNDSIATALVTGQTGDVAVEHAAVLQPPAMPDMHARKGFWAIVVSSALAGFLLGRVL